MYMHNYFYIHGVTFLALCFCSSHSAVAHHNMPSNININVDILILKNNHFLKEIATG